MDGFMLNLHKSQLVQAAAQVLRHLWTLGSFWVPNITKLTTLIEKLDGALSWSNWASLYGLLLQGIYPGLCQAGQAAMPTLGPGCLTIDGSSWGMHP